MLANKPTNRNTAGNIHLAAFHYAMLVESKQSSFLKLYLTAFDHYYLSLILSQQL